MTPHQQMWVEEMGKLAVRVRLISSLPLSQPVSLPVDSNVWMLFTPEMNEELGREYGAVLRHVE